MRATLKQLVKKVRFSFDGAKLDWAKQSEWQQEATGYRCTLKYKGRQYSFDFWQGPAISRDPDAAGCLDCLLSDAQGGRQSFEDFCGEFGYDTDSRSAEQTHKACEKVAEGLERLFGDEFETWLYADRN